MMITRMNLCLSNRCTAHCVFCPPQKGPPGKVKNMPFGTALRCIEEAATNGIRQFSVGENGDALLNENFYTILKHLRGWIPDAEVVLFTNFKLLDACLSQALLAEHLVQAFYVNVDGIAGYERVKGIAYELVRKNIEWFLTIRADIPAATAQLNVRILSLAHYSQAMRSLFGRLPSGLPENCEDETQRVIEEWSPRLRPGESIMATPAVGWAHRGMVSGDPGRFACTQLERMENEAFIAPNGDWYLCCLMNEQNVVVGNIVEHSLVELAESLRRVELIRALRERRFTDVGYPCTTVQACQQVGA